MSIFVSSNLVPIELDQHIMKTVFVEKKLSGFIKNKFKSLKPDRVYPYRIETMCRPEGNIPGIHLPFRWALDNVPGLKRIESNTFAPLSQAYRFHRTLRDIQKEVKPTVISALNQTGCHLLSLYPGAGKTNLAIYIATKIKMKTLIICDSIVLLDQWKSAIVGCLDPPPSVAIIKQISASKGAKAIERAREDLKSDFLLIYVENISVVGREAFRDVGFVIIDEIHKIVAENLSTCLFHLSPRFLLGLSATPTRPDGMDKLLDFYFGGENKTVRELYHPHIVYRVDLPYSYDHIPSSQWSNLITEQCISQERNEKIVGVITKFLRENPQRNVLVLSKRIEQVVGLEKLFQTEGFHTTSLAGTNNVYDPNAQIILGITAKVGTGFSCDKLDTLVLASDLISTESSDYMVQYIARVMRTKEVEPIIFDFVDQHSVLKKHFGVRKKQYLKFGGKMIDYIN